MTSVFFRTDFPKKHSNRSRARFPPKKSKMSCFGRMVPPALTMRRSWPTRWEIVRRIWRRLRFKMPGIPTPMFHMLKIPPEFPCLGWLRRLPFRGLPLCGGNGSATVRRRETAARYAAHWIVPPSPNPSNPFFRTFRPNLVSKRSLRFLENFGFPSNRTRRAQAFGSFGLRLKRNVSLRPVRSPADQTKTVENSTRPFRTLTTNSPISAKKRRLANSATLGRMFCRVRTPKASFGNWNTRKRFRKTVKPEGFGFRADTPLMMDACL